MDRHRGDRGGERQRGPSRWSDGPPANQRHPSRGGGDGGFDDGGRHHPYRGGGGGRGRGEPDFSLAGRGPYGGGRHNWYRGGGGPHDYPLSGGRGFDGGGGRHHPYRGGGSDGPPDFPFVGGGGGGGFAGPPFRHGGGIPVGQGQHFPMGGPQRRGGGFSPNVRGGSPDNAESSNFAKLFIGSVPRTVTEEDIRPLFEEHGNVVEVALIKDRRTGQQQGCCFVKYATLEEADRAIRALHNQVTLPGGLGPIQVRYADGERERLGAVEHKLFVGSLNKQASENEIREIFAPYGHVEDVYIMKDDMKQSRGCGFVKFSDRDMASAAIDALNGKYTMRGCDQPMTVRFADPKKPRPGESRGGPSFGSPGFGPRPQLPSSPGAWHPPSPRSRGSFDGDLPFKGFSPSIAQVPLMGQQGPPLQKQVLSPKDLQVPYSSQAPMGHQMGPMQTHRPVGGPSSLTQSLPGQPLGNQLPTSQSFIQSLIMPASTQQPLTSPNAPPQMMLQPQAQSIQSTFQTSQQSFSQLQQHLQQIHPSQVSKPQTAWGSSAVQQPVSVGSTMAAAPPVPAGPVTCNWTEHTSPEGYKYYYNSVTKESRWEKPEELSLFEQQQQQKLQSVQNTAVPQVQMHTHSQLQMLQPSKQVDQLQQVQGQMQSRQQPNILHYQSPGAVSSQIPQDMGYGHHQQARGPPDAAHIQQGLQAAQEWMWKNKPAGV